MKFLSRYYSQLITLLIGAIVGFLCNRIINGAYFEQKINPVSAASFALTIILALYLEFSVRPSISNNRNEKDLLIDQLKEMKTSLSEIHSLYISSRDNNLTSDYKKDITVKLRTLSNQINALIELSQYCVISKSFLKKEIFTKPYFSYKAALTGNGFDLDAFVYDRIHFNDTERKYNNLGKAIMHCIVDVNKL